jgi:hypothetical protein
VCKQSVYRGAWDFLYKAMEELYKENTDFAIGIRPIVW